MTRTPTGPKSWIPPDHILDLRARVRLRHTVSEQRGEWQQRIQATLYHHGCPQRRQLMTGDGREWLVSQPLPAAARDTVTIAPAMIDALDRQLAPLDKELRAYARRQVGCKALMAHNGIGDGVEHESTGEKTVRRLAMRLAERRVFSEIYEAEYEAYTNRSVLEIRSWLSEALTALSEARRHRGLLRRSARHVIAI